MPSYKLSYFDARGLAEGIRMILSYMDQPFEDERIEFKSAEWEEKKKGLKFGKLPVLEIDGELTCQSTAICRYLAADAGLNGSNAKENLRIDMVSGSLKDLITEVGRVWVTEDEALKEKLTKALKEEKVPKYLSIYDGTIAKNNGYLANGKLSWVDFWLIGYLETLEVLVGGSLFEKYPNVKALKEKIQSIPNVKKWIDSRPKGLY